MLDSSPIHAPPRKKLKRSASLASLPSPPPSVLQSRKRPNLQTDSDIGSASEQEEGNDLEDDIVIRPKILFPTGPSTDSSKSGNSGDPFVIEGGTVEQLPLEPAILFGKQSRRPVSPPPSKGKVHTSALKSPRTPPRAKPTVRQLPVCDAGENPFLGNMPSRPRRARSPRDITEKSTLTYVFKGIKTIVPDPYFNLPESKHSKLDYSHPDYSPPLFKPKLLFPEAYKEDDAAEEGVFVSKAEDDEGEESSHSEPRTPENKPTSRLSKVFVDAQGNPLPDSGPEGIRGGIMDADEVGRMAVGPNRNRH